MPKGPGRYDPECTATLMATGAAAAVLIVFNGKHGSGFSATAVSEEIILDIPRLLRTVADQIEEDLE